MQGICIFVLMDDKFIYYLVLGAIYLISRMLKKKKPPKPILNHPSSDDTVDKYQAPVPKAEMSTPPKPSSFEDLLKEISQEYSDRKEPKPYIAEVEEPVEVIEELPKVREKTREEKYVERRHKEMAAEEKRKELIRIAEAEDEHQSHAVLELLQEDGGAANAVILSEILTRKYQ